MKISVIILNWNGCTLTLNCIDSVIKYAGDVTYEIIVVDNGSSLPELEALRSNLPRSVKLLSLNENLYFGEANNIGAEAARGEYILLLNNDVVITEGAIEKLLRIFETEQFPGAAGPKFLYADGSVQEAGAFILQSGWTFQQGKGGVPLHPRFNQRNHVVDYCSAACLLLKKDVFLSIGGFDPLFDPAYFEDVDLALRLRSIGLYVYFCAEAEVLHHENYTSSKIWPSSELMNSILTENHRKFLNRWRTYLDARLISEVLLPDFQPLIERSDKQDKLEARKRVLLCASGLIGMTKECEKLLRIAAALTHKSDITFAAPEACSKARIYSLGLHFGIQLKNFQIVRSSTVALNDYDLLVLDDGWKDRSGKWGSAQPLLASEVSADFLELF